MADSLDTILIAVDGGGTGCRAAIGSLTEGVLARAEGGRANVASDPGLAVTNILDTIRSAATKAGISIEDSPDVTAHLGLAGVMSPSDSAKVASALPFEDVVVTDDRPTAIHGALGGQDGFLLSVGTGTIAACCTQGTYQSVGGWGFHVADQASGAWLGQKTLRQVLLCHDGLAGFTDLTRDVFKKFQDDPNEIVSFSMSAMPGDYGELAPSIVAGANAADPWGQTIMRKGADHLKQCLAVLGCRAHDRICLSGGVGPFYAPYLPAELLAGRIDRVGSALDGAFDLARTRRANRLRATL